MGNTVNLGEGGRTVSAYHAVPSRKARGGIVVIQEIFGVNSHIRSVADGYAAEGYEVLAPALFDHATHGVELGYTETDIGAGVAFMQKTSTERALEDIGLAVTRLKGAGRVGTVGYCWGGTLSYAAATALPISAAVCYYGGGVSDVVAKSKAKVPVLFHFGERDSYIPLDQVEAVKKALPDSPVYVYPADHGFNCEQRGSYDAASAGLARERTLSFFAEYLG